MQSQIGVNSCNLVLDELERNEKSLIIKIQYGKVSANTASSEPLCYKKSDGPQDELILNKPVQQ